MKNQAEYLVERDKLGEPLFIRDVGHRLGKLTITNDAEGVVRRLHSSGRLQEGRRLLYFDSDDLLSEIIHENGVFKGFQMCFL